ncbi:MAG: hypothetical protein RIR48_3543, partial [Bacteroidota bacterium]
MKVEVISFILSKFRASNQLGFIALTFVFLLTLNQGKTQTET